MAAQHSGCPVDAVIGAAMTDLVHAIEVKPVRLLCGKIPTPETMVAHRHPPSVTCPACLKAIDFGRFDRANGRGKASREKYRAKQEVRHLKDYSHPAIRKAREAHRQAVASAPAKCAVAETSAGYGRHAAVESGPGLVALPEKREVLSFLDEDLLCADE